VFDEDGRPFTVRYHLLTSMLLNELQKEHERVSIQARELEELEATVRALQGRLGSAESLTAEMMPRGSR
jgi:hypothetical protein